jgi:predicted Zn finger-like uncharacterized protein
MRIECPECKLSGTIDDSTVPATGLAMTCPRCKKPFIAERPVQAAGVAGAMLDSCPKCQYATFSEEKFAVCPKCGLVVADYHKEQLAARQKQKGRPAPSAAPQRQLYEQNEPSIARLSPEQMQKDEEARRKYGLDKVPGVIESDDDSVAARPAGETPLPVLIAGWGIIIVSVILVGFGISGIMEYLAKVKEAKAAIAAFEETQSGTALFFQFLLFPVLSIIFSVVMLVFGARFLAMKKWSIAALHNGAWTGVGLLALMKISDMFFWFKRASANAPFGYYAMGMFGDVMLMLLFIAPFIALAEYLKSPLFEKSEELFY